MEQHKSSNLKKETLKGLLWMFSGSGLQAIIQFALLVVLSRLISPNEFGVINAAMLIISFSTILSMIGVGPALVQKKLLNDSHIKNGYTLTFFLSTCFTIVILLLSDMISVFFGISQLSVVLKVLCIDFLLKGVSVVPESLLERHMKFELITKIQITSYLMYAAIGITLALLGMGIWALVSATLVQSSIRTVLYYYFTRTFFGLSYSKRISKELLLFGGGITIARINNQIALEGDNFVAGKWLGATALGMYSRSYQLMVMPTTLIGTVMDKVLYPALSRLQDDIDSLKKIYKQGVILTSIISAPLIVFLILYSSEVIDILLGDSWLNVVPIFQILAIGMFFRLGYKINDTIIKALGRVYILSILQGIYAIMVVGGAFLGQHYLGLTGLAYATVLSIILHYIFLTVFVKKIMGFKWIELVSYHVPSLLLGIIIYGLLMFVKIIIPTSGSITSILVAFLVILFIALSFYFIFRKQINSKINLRKKRREI